MLAISLHTYLPQHMYICILFVLLCLLLLSLLFQWYLTSIGKDDNNVTIQGLGCGANLWFGGFPYPVNPGRPEWSKVQTRGKPLVATAQAKCMSADEQ